jgi:hypothetical protein
MDVVSGPEEVDRNACLNSNGNNKNHFAKLQFLKSMSMSYQNVYQPEEEQERRSGEARAAETDMPASLQTDLRDSTLENCGPAVENSGGMRAAGENSGPAVKNSGGTEFVTSHMETEASSEEMDRTASILFFRIQTNELFRNNRGG